MPPVIQFDHEYNNPSENAAIPGTSGYVPPPVKKTQSPVNGTSQAHEDQDSEVTQGAANEEESTGKGKGKGKGKSIAAKPTGIRRKLNEDDFQGPISMYDPVSFPGYLFQPIPSKLKIDELRKRLIIVQIEAARKQAIFCDRFNSLYAPLKDYLCSLPKAKVPEGPPVDEHNHGYTPYKE